MSKHLSRILSNIIEFRVVVDDTGYRNPHTRMNAVFLDALSLPQRLHISCFEFSCFFYMGEHVNENDFKTQCVILMMVIHTRIPSIISICKNHWVVICRLSILGQYIFTPRSQLWLSITLSEGLQSKIFKILNYIARSCFLKLPSRP